ncbi:MAG: HlyC/CorC family transporter [Candidatus Saganbacteria bacterium]|nr:HlyC/CorC family transporter [Candidatus Saganbacteria bacterium]
MIEIIVLVILFLLSAFFSASETALTSLSRMKASRMLEKKIPGAKTVAELKEKPSEFLSTILIGNNLVNVAISSLATATIIRAFQVRGYPNTGMAVGIATGVITLLLLTFGEIVPKTVAIRRAETISLFVAPIIRVLGIIVRPLAYFIGFICRPFIYLFGGKSPEIGPFITEDEIRLVLAEGEKEGIIRKEERQMIASIFEFWDTVAREVMTPRPDISACEANRSIEEFKKIVIESGHSRIPIYENSLDNIIGVIYAKDLFREGEKHGIRGFIRPATFIPETKKVSELLHEMQAARTHMAVIVDEFGMTSGVVTLEDLVEEIVGEIQDEFEREEKMIEKVDDHTFLVDGRVALKDLNHRLKFHFPEEEEYDTIGGFIFSQLGKVPSVGNVVVYQNLRISVERILRRRVTRVKIAKDFKDVGGEAVGG